MKIYHYPSNSAEKKLLSIINRGLAFTRKQNHEVSRILEDVRKNGDAALIRYAARFDGSRLSPDNLQATPQEMAAALKQVSPDFMGALDRAASQIEDFHRRQLRQSWIASPREGTLLGQLVHPVDAAGVYVPGGKGGRTPLASSVLMGAIPARIAGVKNIYMVTPPTAEGGVNPHLLAAAHRAGVTAIFKTGSAWAIGALAYGTTTIPRVDVIVGPGNIYVTLAKKLVSGIVGIDMIAGPSEIMIVADETADPEFVAADLLSQAEHDALASSVLATSSRRLARETAKAVSGQIDSLSRRAIAQQSISKYGAILVVADIPTAIDLANRIAPEHLELQIRDPFSRLDRIRHAGAVFLGGFTPEPVGDYMAGPNHVLPTAGTARFSSALSVEHFIKRTSLIHYTPSAFRQEAEDILRLAEIEGLDAHANSVRVRLRAFE